MTSLSLAGLLWLLLYGFKIRPCWLAHPPSPDITVVPPGGVSIIIPARNEARHLPSLLASLAGEGDATTEILVVNDGSTDHTADCVRQAAKEDVRVRLIDGRPKPPDWTGKPWAVSQAADEARGDWLLFLDADVVVQPGTLQRALCLADQHTLDALSLIPGMKTRHIGVAMLLSIMALARAVLFRPATPERGGMIQGAFLLVRSRAYREIGGHACVRSMVLEDVALGRQLHKNGFRVQCWSAPRLLSTPMFTTFRSAWNGLTKHCFAVLDFSFSRLAFGFVLHAILVPLPAIGLLVSMGFAAHVSVLLIAAVANLLMLWSIGSLARHEGMPLVTAALAPLSFFLFLGVVLRSTHGYRSGTIVWKGRSYAAGNLRRVGTE